MSEPKESEIKIELNTESLDKAQERADKLLKTLKETHELIQLLNETKSKARNRKDFLVDSLMALTMRRIAEAEEEGVDDETLCAITKSVEFLVTCPHEVSQDYHNPVL